MLSLIHRDRKMAGKVRTAQLFVRAHTIYFAVLVKG
jgi:hypothetical protein